MLYSIENRDYLENLEELASLKNQTGDLRLQDQLDKQNFLETVKRIIEPVAETKKPFKT